MQYAVNHLQHNCRSLLRSPALWFWKHSSIDYYREELGQQDRKSWDIIGPHVIVWMAANIALLKNGSRQHISNCSLSEKLEQHVAAVNQ